MHEIISHDNLVNICWNLKKFDKVEIINSHLVKVFPSFPNFLDSKGQMEVE